MANGGGGVLFLGKLFFLKEKITPSKFNIAPEKWWLEDYFPIGKVLFRGDVKLRGGGYDLEICLVLV